ncbi:unnamed protein product [Camellia sinensis]
MLKSIPASGLLRKLRWSTLGLQFDWSKRNYNVSLPHNKTPDALCQLAKKMAAPAMLGGEQFCPEAAIVNYFGLGDTLGGHLDDMEADWTKPIVSIRCGIHYLMREIDGLAPCRTRQQDQTHNSVVSTLLALLDGLKSRGSVVVIGATNRPDAVDPALRRPGRFVREIYFPLPSVEDRAAILSLHTQSWPKPVTGSVLNWIARRTVGFAGVDLQALCTQAAIIALRRNCPLQEILSVAEKKASHGKRPLPTFAVEERDWLESLACAPPLSSQRGAGMAANDVVSSPLCSYLIPCLRQPLSRLLVSLYLDERLLLPPHLYKAATLVKSVIVSALDKEKVPSDHWWFRVHDLLQETDVLREIEINLSRGGILIGQASDSNFDDWGEGTNDDSLKYKYPKDQQIGTRPSLLRNIYYASANKLGFRMLISGSPRSGQRYLASCLLHCFVGNMEIQKVDLATISQEGHRDVTQGVTRILGL